MSSIHSKERDLYHLPECEASQLPKKPSSKTSQQPTQNILIAVMGVTGVGKSYFIQDVSGLSTVVVGGRLASCTSEVIEYAFEYAGVTITLIDTPGFNNTKLSDMEVLTRITSWTQKRYNDHQLLSGIIYLHRITDVRMEDPPLKNLRMFEKLVGRDCLHNVLLTSTHWSEVAIEKGETREVELKLTPEYWGNIIGCGGTVARYTGCRESGLKLIDKLIGNKPKALNIQEELAIPGTEVMDTGAGMIILEEAKKARNRTVVQQRDRLKEMLEAEQQRMQERLDKITKDCEESLARQNADLIGLEEQTANTLAAIEQKLEAERRERVEEQQNATKRVEIMERDAEAENAKLKVLIEAEMRKRMEEVDLIGIKAETQIASLKIEMRNREIDERIASESRAREEAERRAMEEAERAKLRAMIADTSQGLTQLERRQAEWREETRAMREGIAREASEFIRSFRR